jgi:hypothetical protein
MRNALLKQADKMMSAWVDWHEVCLLVSDAYRPRTGSCAFSGSFVKIGTHAKRTRHGGGLHHKPIHPSLPMQGDTTHHQRERNTAHDQQRGSRSRRVCDCRGQGHPEVG